MTAAPYALRRVILHAARSKEYPAGSIRRGYDFIAPLTPEGRIDRDGWKTHRGECFAHRFWDDEPAQRGLLVHRAGGRGGSTWGFELGTGARLEIKNLEAVPDQFMLLLSYDGRLRRQCSVVWRSETAIGIEFAPDCPTS